MVDHAVNGTAAAVSKPLSQTEDDPLDAFMALMNEQVRKQDEADARETRPKTADELAQPMDLASRRQGGGAENGSDDDEVEDMDGSEDGPISAEAIMALAAKKAKRKELPTVDHSKIDYEPFRKNFYIEPIELQEMTDEQVDDLRIELNGIKLRGKDCPKPVQKWSHCGLNQATAAVIKTLGYEGPTPIQAQAIPAIMCGRDVIGVAKTGTGKTIAFLLPMFRHIKDQRPIEKMEGSIALIMTPTRELATQIHRECKPFLKALDLRAICAYGGSPIKDQIAEFKRGAEIVVCTPGRMIDLLTANQGRVTNLRRTTYVVLDEADRMFDMGFEPQVMKIIGNIRADRQTVLFSATFPKQMETLARKILKKPVEIVVGARSVVAPEIHQIVEVRNEDEKFIRVLELLGELYKDDEDVRCLIFVDRQEAADALLNNLMQKGYPCMSLHGGKDQFERDTTISDFKDGVVNILTATSVAARGLDVKQLKLVINFDCPNHLEDYVHRVGRTGRAGEKGTAVTFVTPSQGRYAVDIIKALKSSGAEIKKELSALAEEFLEQVKIGREKASGTGFGGKGLERFDKDRDLKRKMQKRAFGADDEEDEEVGEIQTAGGDDEGSGLAQIGNTDSSAYQETGPLAALDKARSAIAKINSKYKATGTGAPTRTGKDIAGDSGEYYTSMEINDFPQKARWAVTNRTNIAKIIDLCGVSITTKGNFYGPGKVVPPGESKLYILVEGQTQKCVDSAMRELRRLLTEATTSAIEGESRIGSVGRYTVV